jgi:aminoacyl-tRNA hydrolase
MKLIVGLGNPGKEYENTRHNLGYLFIDYYLNKKGINLEWKEKFNGLYLDTVIGGEKIIFMKPLTYMNLSGEAVKKYLDYFKIDVSDLLVVVDDLDLAVGNYKIKNNGSSGGHNGLKNIELHIGTQNYKRFRIGISNTTYDVKDYVLGKISVKDYYDVFDILSDVLDRFYNTSFDILMSKYNRKNK